MIVSGKLSYQGGDERVKGGYGSDERVTVYVCGEAHKERSSKDDRSEAFQEVDGENGSRG